MIRCPPSPRDTCGCSGATIRKCRDSSTSGMYHYRGHQQNRGTAIVIFRILIVLFLGLPLAAQAQVGTIGIVIMHGKGGSPTGLVAGLARALEEGGYLVANLEMPW